ncbi:MAG TPA: iron-sulfur cluster biosynthesis protein [Mycobacteriales bacterium]|nr:iron-sulfur cluster biosynthesis protein [Mycobacteriales bacterium]
MLTLTENARLAIVSLVEPTDPGGHGGVRIAMTPASNGDAPQLGLQVAPGPAPGDSVIDDEGARVFLDESAGALLDDQTLDVRIDEAAQEVDFYVS